MDADADQRHHPERDRSAPSAPEGGGRSRFVRPALLCALPALALWLVVTFVAQPYGIPSGSMAPLLRPGDRVLVDRLAYRAGNFPHRGDVVVFDGNGSFTAAEGEDFVKRVVGVGGDRVRCCDARGRLVVNGEPLTEPYLHPGDAASKVAFDIAVPQGRLWVMGDHRSDSRDSRDHLGEPGGGTVPVEKVVGRVDAVLWPADRWGPLRQEAGPRAQGAGRGAR